MSLIDGVGGAFLFSEDPKRLADWYTEHLGVDFEGSEEFGAFYVRYVAADPDDAAWVMDTTFAIMKAKRPVPRMSPNEGTEQGDMYGDQPFMINLRVRDLEAVLRHLAERGVEPLRRDDEGYALFAWIRDAEGNRVELYQPRPDAA
ncbi:MAG: VOC family protein [Acidobacteria bacterium]|nr:VOC family protein [Acidobacteriota bacterium]